MATVKENILNSLGWFYEDLEKYALDDINKSIEAEATARENADSDLKDNYIPEYAKDNTWLLAGGEEISTESDLDDYTEQGNYYCRTNANARTLLNCPVTYAFTMKVYAGVGRIGTSVYMTQHLETYNITSTYERYYSSDSSKWLSWHRVPYMDDVDSAVEAEAKTRESADTSLQSDITDLQDSHVCLTDSEYSNLPDTKLTNDTFYFVNGESIEKQIQNIEDDILIKSGETLTGYWYGAGWVSSSSSSVYFSVPFNKIPYNITSVTASEITFIFRQNNSYCYGSTSSTRVSPGNVSISLQPFGYRFTCSGFDETTNVTNNSVIGINAYMTLAFK